MTTLREAAEALLNVLDAPEPDELAVIACTCNLRAALAVPPPDMAEIERLLDEYCMLASNVGYSMARGQLNNAKGYVVERDTAGTALIAAISYAIAQARREGIEAAAQCADVYDKDCVDLRDRYGRDTAWDIAQRIRALGAAP